MKLKAVVTVALLVFVLASVVCLIANEVFRDRRSAEAPPAASSPRQSGERTRPSDPPHHVIAYYFHGNMRCATCRKFEVYTREAIETGFADALKDGRLKWRIVNVDEPGNEDFVKGFRLYTRSVVLVDVRDGKQTAWKNLTAIWDLVGDKDAFVGYVQGEVRRYLGGSG